MQSTKISTARSTADIEREGQFARARDVASTCNPYVWRNPAEVKSAVDEDWLQSCSAWWSGWNREDAKRCMDSEPRPRFMPSDFQACGPEKSALLRSLGDRELGLCDLRASAHGFGS